MQAEVATEIENAEKPKRRLLPLIAAVALGAVGFGASFTGLWSPMDLLNGGGHDKPLPIDDSIAFVPVPPIDITLTGGRHRSLSLSATIETQKNAQEQIETLMPRIADSFNGFLSDIDPNAFDKRGVLEIIKYELAARAGEALPDLPVNDLLITEFRLK